MTSREAVQLVALGAGVGEQEAREEWEERAAIREYLGEQSRAEAELAAVGDAVQVLRRRHLRLF